MFPLLDRNSLIISVPIDAFREFLLVVLAHNPIELHVDLTNTEKVQD